AVKHTEPGDTITLGAAFHGEGPSRSVQLWVSDTGSGIAPEDLGNIFQRFSRGSLRTESSGSGLGLAIVAAITEAHGGEVRVHSVPGEGSTFTLDIPAPEEKS